MAKKPNTSAITIANVITSTRFTISKAGIKKNTTVLYTDKKGKVWEYNQAIIFDQLKSHFEALACWDKYGCYTSSVTLPKFVRDLPNLV